MTPSPEAFERLSDLIDRLQDQSISEDEAQRLHEEVCADPEAAAFYVEYMQMTAS